MDRDSTVSICGETRASNAHQKASYSPCLAFASGSARAASSLPPVNLFSFYFNYNLIKLKLNQTWLRLIRGRSVSSARCLLWELSPQIHCMMYSRQLMTQQSLLMVKRVKTNIRLITKIMKMTQQPSSMNATMLMQILKLSAKRRNRGWSNTEHAWARRREKRWKWRIEREGQRREGRSKKAWKWRREGQSFSARRR